MAKVTHFEILGRDGKKTRKFYSDLFGWEYNVVPEMDYGLVAPQEGAIGGGIGAAQGGAPPHALFYVEVDDVQASLDKAVALGGSVIMPCTVIPDMVTFAIFKDIDGNQIGLAKSAQQ